ncbi:type II toxin-antitoxin system HicB family antitoxin [Xanthobacter sediminis]
MSTHTFSYMALFEAGDEGGIVISFPDVPEAISQGTDADDARAMAREALGLALLTYPRRGLPLPEPKAKGKGLVAIPVEPEIAAKLAVLERFRTAGISKSELARRMGRDEKEVRRILDPQHASKLGALAEALAALGGQMVISVADAA